jgi:rare lipoprotein A
LIFSRAGIITCSFIFILLFASSCSSYVRFSSGKYDVKGIEGKGESVEIGSVFTGKASYYGDEFHGRKTANGEYYDRNKISAAHKTFPFGTVVKVRNLNNNREIIVRINDRGPFVSGRIIDLSYKAAVELDMIRDGVIDVEITVIQ